MKRFNNAVKYWSAGLVAVLALVTANHVRAQNLAAPTSGLLALDLAGNPITTDNIAYSTSFVATSSSSTVTFVFREDPGFFFLSNTSVALSSTPSTNLLLNGDFSIDNPTSPGAGLPDWNYFIQAGNLFPQYLGYEGSNGNVTGFWDGSTQAYDGIDQTFATTVGDTYDITFDLPSTSSGGYYQQISTNGDTTDTGGNGIDALVYAGNGLPPTTNPVPDAASTFVLILVGLGILAFEKTRTPSRAAR
jgi:hypothetical protein